MIKSCTLLTLLLVIFSNLPAQKRHKDSVSLTIYLNNKANDQAQVDSVYLIFDRYDLSGAGLVKKVFLPINNTIQVEKLPKGKYYVEVYCLGNYPGHFNKMIMAHPKARSRHSFRLRKQEFYPIGMAYIPPQKVDFSHLSVTKSK